ncbi:MAG: methylmalonyl-CoA carboxyltransferase [Conexibacter sp.]|jgi:acetyl-CoA carboxylase carboxyltransferase component|nr:methylmalonyl-CoA carboxyltransferase [Conexibacter sp.]MCZ4493986.1 methylmalonyl-CoA carboxyltransferase [Conexibacter sp.]MDX6714155.1 methylmalonyl-CoA decarboxylase subunit alpha [Baekduia sp.]MDX6732414.1 methylmalonyl-CoA decarboxylase subunit alpha [Baekduia sp.]
MSAVFDVLPEQLAARARLELLFDAGSYRPIRSAVGDGVLSGSGRVQGRAVCAWAQDGSFKGGSLGAAGGETIARTIQRADAMGVPVVGFPHSGGARLQEGVAALSAYGSIFRAQAVAKVPMISVVSGPCAGGAAYSPALGDFVVMTQEAVMFLTGPKIIERVTREQISATDLGGPKVHGANGVSHMVARDDVHAAELVRELLTYLPDTLGAGSPLVPPADAPGDDPSAALPESDRKVYDVRDVAAALLDRGTLLELAPKWARNLTVAFGRIEGRAVGVIANQARYLGGCLDADAAEKGAWFVDLCNRFGIPLVVLADTPGFLPGATQEQAGVLRHGASLLRAFGRATVPRVTVTLRQAYGGAHIVMNSRDLGATLTLAWPNARIGVMGARQAVELVRRREIEAGADAALLAEAYEAEHLPVRVAAAAGFVDEVIEPSQTRDRIAHVLELAT